MKIIGDGKVTKIYRDDGTEVFTPSASELDNIRSMWKYIAELTERVEKLEKDRSVR